MSQGGLAVFAALIPAASEPAPLLSQCARLPVVRAWRVLRGAPFLVNSSCTDGMSVARRAIMARRHAVLLGVAALGLVAITAVPSRAESVAARCPQYPTHLRIARDYLARGNQAAAVGELRRAEEALETCLREEA